MNQKFGLKAYQVKSAYVGQNKIRFETSDGPMNSLPIFLGQRTNIQMITTLTNSRTGKTIRSEESFSRPRCKREWNLNYKAPVPTESDLIEGTGPSNRDDVYTMVVEVLDLNSQIVIQCLESKNSFQILSHYKMLKKTQKEFGQRQED